MRVVIQRSPWRDDYEAGLKAERSGQSCKRWQTRAWRDGWAQARSERREREFQAHEAALEDGPCPDQDCPYPYCVQSRECIAAVNAEACP